jgi:hypothetical protein
MAPSSRSHKAPSILSDSAHRQLNMYALAATAAGVGALALTPPAAAEIIYTKTHKAVPSYPQPRLYLELNHDGIADFAFSINRSSGDQRIKLAIFAFPYGNSFRSSSKRFPAAYPAGVRIGPEDEKNAEVKPPKSADGIGMASCGGSSGRTSIRGPWANVTDRYLGLVFHIDGKIHYGWARLNAKALITRNGCEISGTLTGYAYETIPNKSIVTGRTKGPAGGSESNQTPGSLGQLALGSQ